MVVFRDRDTQILPFRHLRKHLPRSGYYLGTLEDSA